MLFNSFLFLLVFLPISLFGFYRLVRLGRRLALVWLFVASLIFYAWWNPAFLVLLLGSMIFNYTIGFSLSRSRGREKRYLLGAGTGANLLLLGYYKYAAFLLGIAGIAVDSSGIILPLAISFFTFTQITFLVDCFRGKIADFDPLHYGLFVVYFPHLIAGPIVHHADLVDQFADTRLALLRWLDIASGLTLFLVGLFKKVVLADQFGGWVNPAYAAIDNGIHLTAVEGYATALAFVLQIYFDYSAYCDMALGISVMFGIRLPLNFNSPLKAASIVDFWRRWNITLTGFLRSYVYRPLAAYFIRRRNSSAQKTSPRELLRNAGGFLTVVVLPSMATMLACGVWHGAGWNFILFGLLHGIYMVVNQTWWMIASPKRATSSMWLRDLAGQALTFSAVTLSLVFFRAPTLPDAWSMFESLAGLRGLRLPSEWLPATSGSIEPWRFVEFRFFHANAAELLWIAAALAIVWLLPNPYQWMRGTWLHLGNPVAPWRIPRGSEGVMIWKPNFAWLAPVALAGACAMVTMGGRVSQFIYFQF